MSALTLKLATQANQRLDLSSLIPWRLAGLTPKEIETLPVGTTREPVTVGDLFKLKGNECRHAPPRRDGRNLRPHRAAPHRRRDPYRGRCWRLSRRLHAWRGDYPFRVGCSICRGSHGRRLDRDRRRRRRTGRWHSGGGDRRHARRAAEHWRQGRPMLGERMRRGLIIVSGGAGDYAGARMIAGTILIKGRVGRWAGYGLRRGSLILSEAPKDLLSTFNDCGMLDFNLASPARAAASRHGGAGQIRRPRPQADGRYGHGRQGRDADPRLSPRLLDVDLVSSHMGYA